MLACSIEGLSSFQAFPNKNILLLIRRSIYIMTLWDTNDRSFSQRANCKFTERKCTEDKTGRYKTQTVDRV